MRIIIKERGIDIIHHLLKLVEMIDIIITITAVKDKTEKQEEDIMGGLTTGEEIRDLLHEAQRGITTIRIGRGTIEIGTTKEEEIESNNTRAIVRGTKKRLGNIHLIIFSGFPPHLSKMIAIAHHRGLGIAPGNNRGATEMEKDDMMVVVIPEKLIIITENH